MQEVQSQTQVQTHTYRDRDGWHARSEVNVSATRCRSLQRWPTQSCRRSD